MWRNYAKQALLKNHFLHLGSRTCSSSSSFFNGQSDCLNELKPWPFELIHSFALRLRANLIRSTIRYDELICRGFFSSTAVKAMSSSSLSSSSTMVKDNEKWVYEITGDIEEKVVGLFDDEGDKSWCGDCPSEKSIVCGLFLFCLWHLGFQLEFKMMRG